MTPTPPPALPEPAVAAIGSGLASLASLGLDPLTLCCAAAGVFIVSTNLPPAPSRQAALGRLLCTILLSAVFASAIASYFGLTPVIARAGLAGVIGLGFHTVLASALSETPGAITSLVKRLLNTKE